MANRPALRPRNKAATPAAPETNSNPEEKDADKEMMELAKDIVAKGRMLAERNVPSFIPALRASTVMLRKDLPTIAGIDRFWRTYWNPKGVIWLVDAAEKVSAATPCKACGATKHNKYAYVAGVWVHEVGHCVFRCWDRREDAGFSNHHKWNIAHDLEMNDDIPGIGKAAEAAGSQGNKGPCPAMCLPAEVQVNVEEYDLWNSMGSQLFKATTGKDMFDVFRPVGTYPMNDPAYKVKPFLMFPDKVPTGKDQYIKLDEGKIAEVYYELIPDNDLTLDINAMEVDEQSMTVTDKTNITVTLEDPNKSKKEPSTPC